MPTGNKGCDSHMNKEQFTPQLAEQAEIKATQIHPLLSEFALMIRPKRLDGIAIGGDWLVRAVFITRAGKPLPDSVRQ